MPTGRIEHRRASTALEQADAQPLLQHTHLRAHRRLSQANLLTRRREGAMPRHRHKGFQFAQHRRLD